MKILSKKKYNKLIEDFEESQKKVEELKRINESLGKKLEDKKTSYKLNSGKDSALNAKTLTDTRHIGERQKSKNAVACLMCLAKVLKERGLENEFT